MLEPCAVKVARTVLRGWVAERSPTYPTFGANRIDRTQLSC